MQGIGCDDNKARRKGARGYANMTSRGDFKCLMVNILVDIKRNKGVKRVVK